jgi:hypothetical protein
MLARGIAKRGQRSHEEGGMMVRSKLTLSALLLALLYPVQPAQADEPVKCPPGLGQDNNNQPYHFKTSSRLDPASIVGYQSQIVSCVENENKTGVIINWRLGGYDGAVAGLDANDGRPFPIPDYSTTPLDSCLAYGGRPDTKRVGVLVHAPLAQLLANDEQGDCIAVLKKPIPPAAFLPQASPAPPTTAPGVPQTAAPGPVQFKDWHQRFRGFYPNLIKNIDATLLRFDGTMNLFLTTDGLWQSSMQYEMTRYRDSSGIPERLSFEPEFPSDAKDILAAFREKYPERIRGAYKDDINFRFKAASTGHLTLFSLAVHDSEGIRVGSFPLAVIAP